MDYLIYFKLSVISDNHVSIRVYSPAHPYLAHGTYLIYLKLSVISDNHVSIRAHPYLAHGTYLIYLKLSVISDNHVSIRVYSPAQAYLAHGLFNLLNY